MSSRNYFKDLLMMLFTLF